MQDRQVVVVGCGPAGLASAIEAAQAGAKVTVVDENSRPGGQLFKQIHKFFGSKEHYAGVRGVHIGMEMLKRADELGIEVLLNSVVYGIFENRSLGVITNNSNGSMRADRIVIATGASENALEFPGWTLPGIMGAGGAQTMVNLHRVLPGRRCVMVGSGNVGLIVAYQLLQAGIEVVAIVEAASKIGGYAVHAEKIRRAGVPILLSHSIKETRGKEAVEEVILTGLNEKWQEIPGTERTLWADFVCLAVGLTPLVELGSMANCQCKYISNLGGHVLLHDENMETTVPGIFSAGDCTGIEEASIAMEEGRLAGVSIAESVGLLSKAQADEKKVPIRDRLKELRGKPGFYSSSLKLENSPGYPTEERLQKGPVAVIECKEEIPCDPCAFACPRNAISVDRPITKLPRLNMEKCTGCSLCIPSCPGLAIFVVDKTYSPFEALLQLPYEFLPLPKKDERVDCLDRMGQKVTEGKVVKVSNPRQFDHTPVLSVVLDKKYADTVRSISLRKKVHRRG